MTCSLLDPDQHPDQVSDLNLDSSGRRAIRRRRLQSGNRGALLMDPHHSGGREGQHHTGLRDRPSSPCNGRAGREVLNEEVGRVRGLRGRREPN
jgi:hypothetical protein